MRSIDKPTFHVQEVFHKCISNTINTEYKAELAVCADFLVAAEDEFEAKFTQHEIFSIPQLTTIFNSIGKSDMVKIYDTKMAKSGSIGNNYYSLLKLAAPKGICPLCDIREANTLDHYLPKSKYPIYSVTPINLIPSCLSCNRNKLIGFPTTSEDQTLHPYYDNIEAIPWLEAQVLHTDPIGFTFTINPSLDKSLLIVKRLENHFKSFSLNSLYASNASREYSGIKLQLRNLRLEDQELLKTHLYESYRSWSILGINMWRAVMYKALYKDEWFCDRGILS